MELQTIQIEQDHCAFLSSILLKLSINLQRQYRHAKELGRTRHHEHLPAREIDTQYHGARIISSVLELLAPEKLHLQLLMPQVEAKAAVHLEAM